MQFQDRILSGIPRKEILAYFRQLQADNSKKKESNALNTKNSEDPIIFKFESCKIRIFDTNSRCLPSFLIPCTEILFSGPKSMVEKIISQFRLKFLRGGG
ncbi:MAG: hypothetical protein DRO88_10290 [Promethearchaeia archaeon]|nr:MAG: hypothetical protein DRO88_10290 [Candidatus Lokiarchaeia archaeon]